MLRIVLFGDGAWAARSLLVLQRAGHAIAGVVARAQPSDGTLAAAAQALGVPLLQPAHVNAPAFLETISALRPDLHLSISYNQILRRPVLESARLGAINVHAGKLPYYRGRNVINWAIINGEPEIGITVHFMDAGIDTGDIIVQRVLPIGWTDTYRDVLGRVVDAIPALVCEAVEQVASGQMTPTRQADKIGTYFGGRSDGDEWLDWADSSFNLHNKIRAITRPGPGARTLLDETPVTIWRACYDPDWPSYIATPGQVVGRRADGVVVKTGDSTIVLQEAQRMNDACETPRWPIGTRLGLNMTAYVQSLAARVAMLEQRILAMTEGVYEH